MEIPSIHPEQERHSTLLKPSGYVNQLEAIASWFSMRQNQAIPEPLKPEVILFAADHGVAAPAGHGERTTDLVRESAAEGSAIRHLCQQAGASLHIVDLGVADGLVDVEDIEHAKVRSNGAADISRQAAMDQMNYWECVGIGEEMAHRAIADGANLLVASSISCGDNIAIAAIVAELAGLPPKETLISSHDSDTCARELAAVDQALARARGTPSRDILREIGGLEFAAMAGFYRAAAAKGVPVLLDGYASVAAALAAVAWDVRIAGWLLASHVSDDNGHREALESLGLEPMMELQSSIGKGKVAALLLPVLQSAVTLRRGLTAIEA
ncbi:nicotinate-nucleotide--dimethylbenzimidazole phosphoribosyltransferase [Mariprofundus ferrooxydans]|uniref:nicotinate-nucleotide--dimethylbenzimidazole phosphoribosyltransferase n=1 Tax=Mariprofundus ferrooxydans TaxID=314344 RepID=UPI001430269E|nr:nicotinate-nucleotide--dimethylbenzimidazole phosphoribosyltransferase [Mariprofundus ferrooxydans]